MMPQSGAAFGATAGLGGLGQTANPGVTSRSFLDGNHDQGAEKRTGIMSRSGREIITMQVGKAGNGMGHEFLRDLVEEHKIEYKNDDLRGTFYGDDTAQEEHADVFFNEGAPHRSTGRHRYVPRCILLDLNMQDLAQIASGPLGHLYRPENIVGSDDGSGNCYAKARFMEGPELIDMTLDIVRKEAEKSHLLQGVQLVHSISGGTGSGVGGLLLEVLHDHFSSGVSSSNVMLQSFCLVPSMEFNDIIVEPYNAILGLRDIAEHCRQCFVYDNYALSRICQKSLGEAVPKRQQMNNIVALCMSGISSGMRFKGPLNADYWKMHTSLVPFEKCKFLCSSFAPLNSNETGPYRKKSVMDLAQQMLARENITVNIDPLEKNKSRILASWAAWRGDFKTAEVDRILYNMSKKGSRFDEFYPDWIPHAIATNVCRQGHCEHGESVVYVANNTSVVEIFDYTVNNFDKLISTNSFVHSFEHDGITKDELKQAKGDLMYVREEYMSRAAKPDRIIEDQNGHKFVDEGRLNNAETAIAQEILELEKEMRIALQK